jgi:imidazoleglycerol-phosphate dehydratase
MSTIVRETRETTVRVELTRGSGAADVQTGIRFLDHMLVTLARYSGLDLHVRARGDLKHHLIEDVAICVGAALAELVPRSAARYGDRTVPMDDALVHCALDVGGRPYYRGPLPSALYDHWMRSFTDNARATLHLRVLRGTDRHHVVEAAFKALGLALRDALEETGDSVFSTKGSVKLREAGGGRVPAAPPRAGEARALGGTASAPGSSAAPPPASRLPLP